jgi:hypothetical protein
MQVVNKRGHVPTPNDIYIGRPSVLGNPYSHLENTLAQFKVANREEAVTKYRVWLKFQISSGNKQVLDELSKIKEDSILVCWCKPLSCHGDIIKEVLGETNYLKGYKKTVITQLKQNEVFVFGSNAQGFHGAGSAGMAMRGTSANTWRQDAKFLKAMNAKPGSPDRKGVWAIYGVARGYQEGIIGKSYAIQTIIRPGQRRSTSLAEIKKQFIELFTFANKYKGLNFLMTPVGCGYSGYTIEEMRSCWNSAIQTFGELPPNIIAKDLYSSNVTVDET